MSKTSVLMGKPAKYTVDDAANFLKRLYFAEREVMRSLGGYLASVYNWELKSALPRHFWQDSLRADALRTRVLELRYPRRDVDQDQDPLLRIFLEMLIRCKNDTELVQGVYVVAKQKLVEAYEYYMANSDHLDDEPTIEFMKRFPDEIRRQLVEIQAVYPNLQSADLTWAITLEAYVKSIGGLLGITPDAMNPLEQENWRELVSRPSYKAPKIPHTDPRFGVASFHYPTRAAKGFLEEQIWSGISHCNEIWASEVPGLLSWVWNDMPWEFYMDAARWAYDESRHNKMGEERMKSWGFELGVDIPRVSDHYISQFEHGEIALLSLLHAFECNSPAYRNKQRDQYRSEGDLASAQDFDYDWADESIHMQYGHKWLMHLFKNDLDKVEDAKEEAMDRWLAWAEKQRQQWDYQPYMERIENKIKEMEANRHAKHQITLLPDDISFEVEENEVILDAAIRQNIELIYTCRNGTCRTCLIQVCEGSVNQLEPEICLITAQELEAGRRLACMSTLASAAVIEKVARRRKRETESGDAADTTSLKSPST